MKLQIRDWSRIFETSESKKVVRLSWVAMPNGMNTGGFAALMDHPNAAAHFGAWCAMVQIASTRTPRGTLPEGDGTLPGICRALGRISRIPASVFEELLPRLLKDPDILWIESPTDAPGESPGTPPVHPEKSGLQNITEQNITEQNNTHTQPLRARVPLASDLSGQVSSRFEDWWRQYPRQQRKDFACREWVSRVTPVNEAAVFACLSRYLLSDEVGRGVVMNPDKWLYEQGRANWAGSWPPRRAAIREISRQQQQADQWKNA